MAITLVAVDTVLVPYHSQLDSRAPGGSLLPSPNVAPTIVGAPDQVSFTGVGPHSFAMAPYCTDVNGDTLAYSLTATRTGVTINSSTGVITIATSVVDTSGDVTVSVSDGLLATEHTFTLTVSGERSVWWTADLETGAIVARTNAYDSAYIKTLDEPQADATTLTDTYSGTSGGYGTTATNRDVHVVASELVNGVTVTPRRGNYFLRTKLYFNKRYESLNGATVYPTDSLNKPRCEFAPPYTPITSGTVAGKWTFDWDTEVWIGFSVFLPTGWEHETGTKNNLGSNQIFDLLPKPSATHAIINIFVPNSGLSVDHWNLKAFLSATSTDDSAATGSWESLGSVVPDLGLWTDFVIRYRGNPFTTTTNASTITGGKNQSYEGNKGIFQLWKSEGAVDGNGNRPMVLKKDIVNAPVGLVPQTAYPHLHMSLRQYKYGWHNNPTDVVGPIWMGFDEYRLGRAIADGASFADVAPSGLDQR